MMGEVASTLLEWLNGNSHRSFPLCDDSVAKRDGSGLSVPNWMVLDFRVVDTMGWLDGWDAGDGAGCRLRSYTANELPDGLEISVTMEYMGRSGIVSRSVGAVPFGGTQRVSSSFSVPGHPGSLRSCIVFGAPLMESLDRAFLGEHVFFDPPRFLESRQVRIPGGVGIDRILTNSGGTSSNDIFVKDGKNTSFRIENERIKLSVGPSLGEGFDCAPDDGTSSVASLSKHLYSINGVRPDSSGNLLVRAGPGVRISSGSYGAIPAVVIKTSSTVDSFAKPR